MGDVIQFNGVTKLDLDPDIVLDNIKGKLHGFIIAGYTKDGDEFFSSTYADGGDAIWLAERFKKALLNTVDDN